MTGIGMNAEQQEQLRQLLIRESSRLEEKLESADRYGLNESLADSVSELSAYDNHPADIGTEVFERGKDLALLDEDERHLQRVREALQAMEQGDYGICATCGEPIPAERLFALPDTRYCVAHSPRSEVSLRRPVEEDMLRPPFGRTSMDERDDYNGLDGEDAWQIVEHWGTSTSPATAETPSEDFYDAPELESDENDGYVEAIESFLATDITGRRSAVVRNRAYRRYMERGEGDPLLEVAEEEDD